MNQHVTAFHTDPPWPWSVHQLGPVNAPVYYIFDRKKHEVARFFGHRAQQNCELFMELRAQKETKLYVPTTVTR